MAPHPGAIIKDHMVNAAMTPKQLSLETGVEDSTIYRLLKGQVSVSVGMAFRLTRALGMSPKYWLDLQTSYNVAQWDAES